MRTKKFLKAAALALCVTLTLSAVTPAYAATPGQAGSAEKVHYGKVSAEDIALIRPMFDAAYYAANNPDVVSDRGSDPEKLFDHFITAGIFEGRACNKDFNVSAYRSSYSDLEKEYKDEIVKYYIHYQRHGKGENRSLTTVEKAVAAGKTVRSAVEPSVVVAEPAPAPVQNPAQDSKENEKPAEEQKPEEQKPEEQKPEEQRAPMKISVILPSSELHTEADPNYDELVKFINEYTNMDVQWEWEDDRDFYYQNLGLKFAANDFRDVMVVDNGAVFRSVAKDNFWDLTDYIDDYDNLRTIPAATRANCSINGRIYGIPRSRTLARNGFGYRADWCEKFGLNTPPTTWDEFYDMCYKFTYDDPDGNGKHDTYGLGLDAWSGVFNLILVNFGVPNEWGIDVNGDLIPAILTDEWKTGLKALRKMYADGLINPDFMEHSPGKLRAELLNTGICGSGFQVLDDQRKVETYFEGADVGLADPDNPIYLLGGYLLTESGKNEPHCYPTTGMNNMIAISKKNIQTEEQLKRVLGFLNDINDGEVLNAIEYGFEGKTWDKDENGYVQLKTNEELEAEGISTTYRNGFNQVIPNFTAPENARPIDKAPANTVVTKLEQQLYADDIQYCVVNYGAGYTSATLDEKGEYLNSLIYGSASEPEGAIVKYIKGVIDDAGLDEILNTWKTSGGDQVIAEMNAAYHAAGH